MPRSPWGSFVWATLGTVFLLLAPFTFFLGIGLSIDGFGRGSMSSSDKVLMIFLEGAPVYFGLGMLFIIFAVTTWSREKN
jgi:hypothetical protein